MTIQKKNTLPAACVSVDNAVICQTYTGFEVRSEILSIYFMVLSGLRENSGKLRLVGSFHRYLRPKEPG
jgi:hypothetical protein